MSRMILQLLRNASAHANDFAARRFPDSVPFIYVAEFPRSGANWLRDMLGDSLQVPVPRYSALPVTFRAILQTHSGKPIKGPVVIYLVRDGRDVLVSHYYKVVNTILGEDQAQAGRAKRRHPSLANAPSDALRSGSGLRTFYDEWRVRSAGSKVDWGTHVDRWLDQPGPRTMLVRYEDMQADPRQTLEKVLTHVSGTAPPGFVLDFALARNAFETKTGRKPGIVDNTSNRRSGKSGAWRDTLPDDLKARFSADFGRTLVRCGYEPE